MKLLKFTVSLLLIMTLMFISTSVAFAEKMEATVINKNGIYVSSVYNGVSPEEEEFTLKKQKAAENYYNAVKSGDATKISQYKSEFVLLTTPNDLSNKNNSLNTRAVTAPVDYRVENLYQNPQEKNYYCGPAAAQSVLANLGVNMTQSQLAGSSYLKTETYGNTPWYLSDYSNYTHYPMLMTMRNAVSQYNGRYVGYVVSPLAQAGTAPLTIDQCKGYVVSTTSAADAGVLACGTSRNISGYKLPGYPSWNVGHWLVSDGYKFDGDYIWIIDPVGGSNAVSWSSSVDRYYTVEASLFRNFASTAGLIW